MPLFESIAVIVLCALAWLWLDSLRVREIAFAAARRACLASGVQLLDESVAFVNMRLARDEDGRMQLQRGYFFEFSRSGDERLIGAVFTRGREVLAVRFGDESNH